MTTAYCLKKPQALFVKNTSLLANCSTHRGETWCACVLHRFHDDQVKLGVHVYYIVSMKTKQLTLLHEESRKREREREGSTPKGLHTYIK